MKKWVLLSFLVAPAAVSLEAINDDGMASVYGQAGITIETIANNADGTVATVGGVRYTEVDEDGLGDEYLELNDLKLQIVSLDNAGNIIGPGSFNTTIDVLASGDLLIRSTDLQALNFTVGSIGFSGRSIGALGLTRWRFAPDSYLETAVLGGTPTKIRARTYMTEGSGIDFRYIEDELVLTSNIAFKENSDGEAFLSEFFVSADAGELRIELGTTRGTLEINDLQLSTLTGDPLLDGRSFGDIGYGDVEINQGYLTVAANPTGEGLQGVLASDLTIGTAFYRTNNKRMNFEDISLKTNGEINYRFELEGTENDFGRGFTTVLSGISDLDLTIGAFVFSEADGLTGRSGSLGSVAIENLNLNGGEITSSLWALSGAGEQGIRLDVEVAEGTSFDFTFKEQKDDDAQISAEVVLGNLASETLIDITKKGLHMTVESFEAEAHVNAIRLGDGQMYQGQTGRLDVDGLTVAPGSYLRVEPIPAI